LTKGKRILKPTLSVQKNKRKKSFKSEETGEAMPVGSTQPKGEKQDRKQAENPDFNHSRISHVFFSTAYSYFI